MTASDGSTRDPMSVIEEHALALPDEAAFEAIARAFVVMPKLRQRAFVSRDHTSASFGTYLRSAAAPSRFALCMFIDFANDPDAAEGRLAAFYDKYAANPTVPSREAHLMMSFSGLFRRGDTLLADFRRQAALPPRPAPPALETLEELALALPADVALDVMERAMASMGDRDRFSIERYAELLRDPELLHAAMAQRQRPVFRMLAMIVASVNDREGTRDLLVRVVEECSQAEGSSEVVQYAKPWAELLLRSRARLVTLPEIIDEVMAAGSLVNQSLDWLPELWATEACRSLAERFADRAAEQGSGQLFTYGLDRLPPDVSLVPLLERVMRGASSIPRTHAGQTLARIDHDDARRVLAGFLKEAKPGNALEQVILDASVRLAMGDLEALGDVVDRAGPKALYVIAKEAERAQLFRDNATAWAEFAVARAKSAPDAASSLLKLLPKEEVKRAVDKLVAPKRHRKVGEPRWLVRYQSGAHEEVWAEMLDAGPAAHAHPEAKAVARVTMERVRENLVLLGGQLGRHGYPVKLKARPLAKLDAVIASIEKVARVPVPLSLRAYWEVVGAVDFRAQLSHRSFHSRWAEWEALDPLQTWEPKRTLRLLRNEPPPKPIVPALRPPVHFAIGLDSVGKVDEQSLETVLTVVVEDAAADGYMSGRGNSSLTFVQYLRDAIGRGGFVALDDPEHRDWNTAEERALLVFPTVAF